MCYFKKHRKKNKTNKCNNGNGNSRQRRKNKQKRDGISELQRLAIVDAVLNKKRLLIYSDSL